MLLFIAFLLKAFLLISVGCGVAMMSNWLERRMMALVQRRLGPNRLGLFGYRLGGLMQPFADAIKLLFKEEFLNSGSHKFAHFLAPVWLTSVSFFVLLGIPLGHTVWWGDTPISLQPFPLSAGVVFLFAVSGLSVHAVLLAGWAAGNKFALLGALRGISQMLGYELVMGLSLIPPLLIYETWELSQAEIWQSSHVWGIVLAPLSFLLFVVSMFAETNRIPLDLAEGESELVAGFLTEYGGMRWSQFFLGEYSMMIALSALASFLFLGGTGFPFLPESTFQAWLVEVFGSFSSWVRLVLGLLSLGFKVGILFFIMLQARYALPRFRSDVFRNWAWRILIPIGFLNIVATAIVLAFLRF